MDSDDNRGIRRKIYFAHPIDACKFKAVNGYKNVILPSAIIMSKQACRKTIQYLDLRHQ